MTTFDTNPNRARRRRRRRKAEEARWARLAGPVHTYTDKAAARAP